MDPPANLSAAVEATPADWEWLLSAAAEPYLDRATRDWRDPLRLIQSLRRELSSERARLVVDQGQLRVRAHDKFSRADQMFFTRTHYEQATEERLAFYKAKRLGLGQPVADLGCGIGGDALALGQRGPLLLIDRNPVAVALARRNCGVYELREVNGRVEDIAAERIDAGSVWHLDPDRRAHGHRVTQWDSLEPGPDMMERLRQRLPDGILKLAPATAVPPPWEAIAEREWLGSRRECRQQVLWLGSCAVTPGFRRATVVDPSGNAESLAGVPGEMPEMAAKPRQWVVEPHAAVLAAGLAATLARQTGLQPLTPEGGYLTADHWQHSPLASAFAVEEVLPWEVRTVKRLLQARGVGILEIKVRGVDLDPDKVRGQFRLRGTEQRTLLVFGPALRPRAILARRINSSPVAGG